MRNPEERYCSDWLKHLQGPGLDECKRCGPTLCGVVAQTFPFATAFRSADKPYDTHLWHVFYDGRGWMQSPAKATCSPTKKRRTHALLGWHNHMFGHLLALIHEDLEWVRHYVPERERSKPPVAVICALQRVAVPLIVLCAHLFRDEVKVYLHHAVRGLSITVVHAIQHRRYLHLAEDHQYAGIQGELPRWYMVYTRAQRRTTMWLETQPFGTPDGKRQECSFCSPSEGGNGGKGHCNSKMKAFAIQRNKVIADQPQLEWFYLGDSWWSSWDKDWMEDWMENFQRVFENKTYNINRSVLRGIGKAMDDCWHQMARGQVELPKLGIGGGQFENAGNVLRALVADRASADGKLVRAFAWATKDAIRARGHGAAMSQWYSPLPPDPFVHTSDRKHTDFALGWGIVAMPCPVVELSDNPSGGLTRVALPFLDICGLSPKWHGDAMSAVEPMLQAVAVVVWNLATTLFPDKVSGASLKLILHKVEVVKDDDGFDLWFNKRCPTTRIATGIVHPELKSGKQKQFYIYLGGGQVDVEQSELLMGAVVLAKDWTWAALTLVASWMLLCCCSVGTPLLADPNLFVTWCDDGKTVSDPLKDQELDPGPVKEERSPQLPTIKEEEPVAKVPAIDCRVSEPSLQLRQQFYHECLQVAHKFLEAVRGWPWKPGEQEACTPEERAERGKKSTKLFRNWMEQCGT